MASLIDRVLQDLAKIKKEKAGGSREGVGKQ